MLSYTLLLLLLLLRLPALAGFLLDTYREVPEVLNGTLVSSSPFHKELLETDRTQDVLAAGGPR
jgi:hypothetical protein